MKTSSKVARIAATLITFGAFAGGASAAITLSVTEVGDDLEISYTGSWDVFSASFTGFNSPDNGFNRLSVFRFSGSNEVDASADGLTLSSGLWTIARFDGIGSGDEWGFATGSIIAPSGYSAGSVMSGSITIVDTDIAGGGFTAGDSGSFSGGGNTVNFSVGSVPEPSSTLLLCLGSFGLLARRKRG